MLKFFYFHTNTHTETFAPLTTCVIDDSATLLKIMPNIDQALLQFINVMNVVDLLLHFCPSFVVKRVQICAVGCQRSGEMKAILVSVVSDGCLSLTLGQQQQQQQHTAQISRIALQSVAFESKECHGNMRH